jgi:cytochrome P450
MVSFDIGRRGASVGAAVSRAPAAHPLWGHLPAFKRDPLGFLTTCAREYGDVVPLRLINVHVLLFNDPAAVEEVLVDRNDIFVKPPVFRRNTAVLGRSLLASDGEAWRRQRKTAQPAFDRGHLAGYAAQIVDAAEQSMAGWREGETYDLHREMARVTVLAVAAALFGAELAKDADRICAAVTQVASATAARFNTYYVVPERLPTPGNRRLQAGMRELHEVVRRLIAARRAAPAERDDLLARYLGAQADAPWLTDRLLQEEVVAFLMTGHESTALTLTWIWHLLSQHPEVEAALAAEWNDVLGGRAPRYADRSRLRLTEAVVQEGLRLYPPVWVYARSAKRTSEVAGYRVPRGRRIAISPWAMHRDPRFYDQPDRFDPWRWLDGRAAQLPKYAFLPFSGGPRACIGAGFAMLEAVLLLAAIGQQVRFVPSPDYPVIIQPAVTLRPKGGLPATIHRR